MNIASSSVATVIAIDIMGDKGTWVATAIMTVIILTFGEIVPKIVAVQTAQGAYDNHVPHSMADTARSQGAR